MTIDHRNPYQFRLNVQMFNLHDLLKQGAFKEAARLEEVCDDLLNRLIVWELTCAISEGRSTAGIC